MSFPVYDSKSEIGHSIILTHVRTSSPQDTEIGTLDSKVYKECFVAFLSKSKIRYSRTFLGATQTLSLQGRSWTVL